jgi:HEPN domain-containing protein
MPDSFFTTADRMHDSSRVLHGNHHYHNACYTAGYVVECYMKLMIELTPSLGTPRSFSHRISDMNNELQYAISSSTTIAAYSSYLLDLSTECSEILSKWNPIKRYADPSAWDSAIVSEQFQQEMEKCYNKVIELHIAGLI